MSNCLKPHNYNINKTFSEKNLTFHSCQIYVGVAMRSTTALPLPCAMSTCFEQAT